MQNKIFINGTGKTAGLVALALAASGFEILRGATNKRTSEADKEKPRPNFLALSEKNINFLRALNIITDTTTLTPIKKMNIYNRGDFLLFSNNKSDEPLASVIASTDIENAIENNLYRQQENIYAPIETYNPQTKYGRDKNGREFIGELVVDCTHNNAAGLWAHPPLTHDYKSCALTCEVEATAPHNNCAAQIFYADEVLALLPLPDKNKYACVWSLPKKIAAALKTANKKSFLFEINKRVAQAGIIINDFASTSRTTHPLHLSLAQTTIAPHRILLGDAAHRVHPLAGLGFNLACRDIIALVDCLSEARKLGLPLSDAQMLADYQTATRPQASATAATTHLLAKIFGTPPNLVNDLGGAGLSLVNQNSGLKDFLINAATR